MNNFTITQKILDLLDEIILISKLAEKFNHTMYTNFETTDHLYDIIIFHLGRINIAQDYIYLKLKIDSKTYKNFKFNEKYVYEYKIQPAYTASIYIGEFWINNKNDKAVISTLKSIFLNYI